MGSTSLDHGACHPWIGVGLAYSDMAVVSMDLDDQIVLCRRAGVSAEVGYEQNKTLDLCNLHDFSNPPLERPDSLLSKSSSV